MFNDFLDQQQEFRRAVPESQTFADVPENIAEQLKGSIPFLREEIPESVSPTRSATPGRPETVRVPWNRNRSAWPTSKTINWYYC